MCFYNDDYEWCAMVVEESTRVADGKTKCDECQRVIPEGQTVHHVFQQEREECQACENGDCQCPVDKDDDPVCMLGDCACAKPDFGETFDYDRCEECDKFLRAVEAAELEEGCSLHESRPGLGSMVNDILEGGGARLSKRYFKKARAMFPELVGSGYLKELWKKIV